MQTFLVSYNLKENFSFLDDKRLFKQLLEAYQILNTLINNGGWQTHPAVKQWRNYEKALYEYIYHCWLECQNRQIATESKLFNKSSEIFAYFVANSKKEVVLEFPIWWGREDIISSHKNRLYCKGEIDIVCAAIKKTLKIKSIDKWLKENYKKTKNQLKWNDCIVLKKFCEYKKIDITEKNWYSQFGWNVNPAGEYIWPISI